jgi:hypothetical protein
MPDAPLIEVAPSFELPCFGYFHGGKRTFRMSGRDCGAIFNAVGQLSGEFQEALRRARTPDDDHDVPSETLFIIRLLDRCLHWRQHSREGIHQRKRDLGTDGILSLRECVYVTDFGRLPFTPSCGAEIQCRRWPSSACSLVLITKIGGSGHA